LEEAGVSISLAVLERAIQGVHGSRKDDKLGVDVLLHPPKCSGDTLLSAITDATTATTTLKDDGITEGTLGENIKGSESSAMLQVSTEAALPIPQNTTELSRELAPNEYPYICAALDLCPLNNGEPYEVQYSCIICKRAMHGALCGSLFGEDSSSPTYQIVQKFKADFMSNGVSFTDHTLVCKVCMITNLDKFEPASDIPASVITTSESSAATSTLKSRKRQVDVPKTKAAILEPSVAAPAVKRRKQLVDDTKTKVAAADTMKMTGGQSQSKDGACNHDAPNSYELQETPSFFTKEYYAKTPTAPKVCAGEECNKTFGGDYKVGVRTPVHCCSNAKMPSNPCKHAYCKPCFGAWLSGKEIKSGDGGTRSSKRGRVPKAITT
jgi:hypothetical protein